MNDKTFFTGIGVVSFLMLGVYYVALFWMVSTYPKPIEPFNQLPSKKYIHKLHPVDTVKNDWVNDPTVPRERRLIYDYLVKQK